MYVDSFVITVEPPEVDPAQRRIVLGEVSDGYFVIEQFPQTLSFGIYLELGFDEGEAGDFEVRLCVEAQIPGNPVQTLHVETVSVAEPSEGWWAPRVVPMALEAKVFAAGEFDALLFVEVDGEDRGIKALFFRAHPAAGAPG